MKRATIGWLALLVMVAGICTHFVLGTRSAAAQGSSVSPAAGEPGTQFAFVAYDFAGGETVNYWISLPDETVLGNVEYAVRADESGRAAWEWEAPEDALPGTWLMVARGRTSGTERPIPFEIMADPDEPNVPVAVVEPEAGPPGTTFEFVARGFEDEEDVHYWLNPPGGGAPIGSRGFKIEALDGRAEWDWKSPNDAALGRWSMVARGRNSNVERVIFFEIR